MNDRFSRSHSTTRNAHYASGGGSCVILLRNGKKGVEFCVIVRYRGAAKKPGGSMVALPPTSTILPALARP